MTFDTVRSAQLSDADSLLLIGKGPHPISLLSFPLHVFPFRRLLVLGSTHELLREVMRTNGVRNSSLVACRWSDVAWSSVHSLTCRRSSRGRSQGTKIEIMKTSRRVQGGECWFVELVNLSGGSARGSTLSRSSSSHSSPHQSTRSNKPFTRLHYTCCYSFPWFVIRIPCGWLGSGIG